MGEIAEWRTGLAKQTHRNEGGESRAILGERTEPKMDGVAEWRTGLAKQTHRNEGGESRAIMGERTEPKWAKLPSGGPFWRNKATEVKEAFWQTKATG